MPTLTQSRQITHAGKLMGAVDTLLYLLNCDCAYAQSVLEGNPYIVAIHAENWPHEERFKMKVKPNTTYEELSKLVEKQVEEIDNWISKH